MSGHVSMVRRWWLQPHSAIRHLRHGHAEICVARRVHGQRTASIVWCRRFSSPTKTRPGRSSVTSSARLAALAERERAKSSFNPLGFRVGVFGRPNVGKSTLFNRLVGKKLALIDSTPGVTRDRHESDGRLADLEFTLIDTAGMERESRFLHSQPSDTQLVNKQLPSLSLQSSILAQTQAAMSDCDVALFMIDARSELTKDDFHFSRILRKHHTTIVTDPITGQPRTKHLPIILIANKVEDDYVGVDDDIDSENYQGLVEAQRLGFGAPLLMSAEHGGGLAALHNQLHQHFEELRPMKETALGAIDTITDSLVTADCDSKQRCHFAIIGKPNVGKSTLINALIGESRMLTGPQPGITRDSIKIDYQSPSHPDYHFTLIDTAGIRGNTITRNESYTAVDSAAMSLSFKTLAMSHVIALVINVTEAVAKSESALKSRKHYSDDDRSNLLLARVSSMIDRQDVLIAKRICDEGRALVLVINKIDLIPVADRQQIFEGLRVFFNQQLTQVKDCPMVGVSAANSDGLGDLMDSVVNSHQRWSQRINTHKLNDWLHSIQHYRPHPSYKGKTIKCKYIAQTNIRPPSFTLMLSGLKLSAKNNELEGLSGDWLKMIKHSLVKEFGLQGLNVRVKARRSGKSVQDRQEEKHQQRANSDATTTATTTTTTTIAEQYDEADEVDDDAAEYDEDGSEIAETDNESETIDEDESKAPARRSFRTIINKFDSSHEDDVNNDEKEADSGRQSSETLVPSQAASSSAVTGFMFPAPALGHLANPNRLYPFTTSSSFLPPEPKPPLSNSLSWERRRTVQQQHTAKRTAHIKEKKGLALFRSPAAYHKSLKSAEERKAKWNHKQNKQRLGRERQAEKKRKAKTGEL